MTETDYKESWTRMRQIYVAQQLKNAQEEDQKNNTITTNGVLDTENNAVNSFRGYYQERLKTKLSTPHADKIP